MHEMSIAQSIIEIVDETMKKQVDHGRLKEVVVEIGELVAVVPDSLEFCYDALIQDTPYSDSRITINIVPLTGECRNCKIEFHIDKYMFSCPKCESVDIKIIQGQNELNIQYLEVD